jgi:hypothetical protein
LISCSSPEPPFHQPRTAFGRRRTAHEPVLEVYTRQGLAIQVRKSTSEPNHGRMGMEGETDTAPHLPHIGRSVRVWFLSFGSLVLDFDPGSRARFGSDDSTRSGFGSPFRTRISSRLFVLPGHPIRGYVVTTPAPMCPRVSSCFWVVVPPSSLPDCCGLASSRGLGSETRLHTH